MREAAELAASEESARWFRKIDVLSVIGNLGPLVGLAGTVYGMILAFTSLGDSGGQAGPGDLSLGISKALFHTLLGLCLAIPCLLMYGLYRGVVDRLCTRGIILTAEILEMLPPPAPAQTEPPPASRSVIASALKPAGRG
jgi:biopolymer transport protein ExbB